MSEPVPTSPNRSNHNFRLLRTVAAGLALTAGNGTLSPSPANEQAAVRPPAAVATYTPPAPENGPVITLPPETTTTTTLPTVEAESTATPPAEVHNEAPDNNTPADTTPQETPDLPQPIIPPVEDGPATDPDNPLLNNAPEILPFPTISPEADKLMKRDVVYIDGNGCSGFLIRNDKAEPIGVATAEHCGFAGYNQPRYKGSDGNTYILHAPMEAKTGDSLDSLTSVGKLDTFLANDANDMSHDQTFGIFEGHTAEEVLAAYRKNALSEDQILQLKLGDEMLLSGWPTYQPNMPGLHRQAFALNVLGVKNVTVTTGESMRMLWAAVPIQDNGTECSFGDSGGEGFVLPEGSDTPQFVGALAAFQDFTGNVYGTAAEDDTARRSYEAQFGLKPGTFDKYAALCGFAIDPPANKPENVLHVKQRIEEIPGYEDYTPEAVMKKAREHFTDTTTERDIIDGVFVLPALSPDDRDIYVDRPYIYYDQKTKKVVLGWYSPKAEDGLNLMEFDDLGYFTIYDRDTTDGITMLHLQGNVQTQPDGFTDATGLSFGHTNTINKVDFSKPYQVVLHQPNENDPKTDLIVIAVSSQKGGVGGK